MDAPYADLAFPDSPPGRPYVYTNMVATIDGKTVSDRRGAPTRGLGSDADKIAMKRIEASADAVIVGAGCVRLGAERWRPENAIRIVVTRTGGFDYDAKFFREGTPIVVGPASVKLDVPSHIVKLALGENDVDLGALLSALYGEFGVRRLLAVGGATFNGTLFTAGLVDEIFLTLAPKVKLGEGLPTYAEGPAFPAGELPEWDLVGCVAAASELFLRYRRAEAGRATTGPAGVGSGAR